MTVDLDYDETANADEASEEEEEVQPAKRRNRMRTILLVLLIIVLLCVVCYLLQTFAGGFLNILPGMGEADTPTPVSVVDTPTLSTGTDEPPPEQTTEPMPGTEEPVTTEEPVPGTEEPPIPGTEEPVVTGEPTEESPIPATLPPTEEGGEEPTQEPTGESTEEPLEATSTPTTVPVPGPTATAVPGATVIVTVEPSCENNLPPTAVANGPYTAMMGKGQAIVTFEATGSTDPDGTIETYEWDFGDGSAPGNGQSLTHGYTGLGSYTAILTVTDNCGATGQDTAEVTVVGPTPPANGTPPAPPTNEPPTPPPTNEPPAGSGTMGFCHRVQYGDTLSGLAQYYGVPLADLAAINEVSTDYLVIAGQGLFIPMEEIQAGPNIYPVQPGNTLEGVAYHCGLTVKTLAEANGLDPSSPLPPGQTLVIPPWRQINP